MSRFFVPSGGTGDWSVAANWSPAAVPDANDTAIINSGRTANVSSNLGTISVLRLGDQATGTLNFGPGSTLKISNQALVGASSGANRGVVNQTGGTISITGGDPVIFLAFDSDDTASYNISGGELDTGNLWFRFGRGTMTQTGGAVNASQLILGEGGNASSQATYDISGGSLKVSGNANIGKPPGAGDAAAGNSHGTMHISGGIATFGDLLFGTDATDFIQLSAAGLLRVQQANYSIGDAQADILAGKITGSNLWVSSVNLSGVLFTQIISVLTGDYNHDGIVSAADYTVWRDTLGSTTDLRADGDGKPCRRSKRLQCLADELWRIGRGSRRIAFARCRSPVR